MSDNVVFLKFRNPNTTDDDAIDWMTCKHCRNKTYTMSYDKSSPYPLVKCAACGSHLGRVGWADDAA